MHLVQIAVVLASDSHEAVDTLRSACGQRRPVRHLRFCAPAVPALLRCLVSAAANEPRLTCACALPGEPAAAAASTAGDVNAASAPACTACAVDKGIDCRAAAGTLVQRLLRVAVQCRGDVRAAFNTLQLLATGSPQDHDGTAGTCTSACGGDLAQLIDQAAVLVHAVRPRAAPRDPPGTAEPAALAHACCTLLGRARNDVELPADPLQQDSSSAAHLECAAQHLSRMVAAGTAAHEHAAADVLAAWVAATIARHERQARKLSKSRGLRRKAAQAAAAPGSQNTDSTAALTATDSNAGAKASDGDDQAMHGSAAPSELQDGSDDSAVATGVQPKDAARVLDDSDADEPGPAAAGGPDSQQALPATAAQFESQQSAAADVVGSENAAAGTAGQAAEATAASRADVSGSVQGACEDAKLAADAQPETSYVLGIAQQAMLAGLAAASAASNAEADASTATAAATLADSPERMASKADSVQLDTCAAKRKPAKFRKLQRKDSSTEVTGDTESAKPASVGRAASVLCERAGSHAAWVASMRVVEAQMRMVEKGVAEPQQQQQSVLQPQRTRASAISAASCMLNSSAQTSEDALLLAAQQAESLSRLTAFAERAQAAQQPVLPLEDIAPVDTGAATPHTAIAPPAPQHNAHSAAAADAELQQNWQHDVLPALAGMTWSVHGDTAALAQLHSAVPEKQTSHAGLMQQLARHMPVVATGARADCAHAARAIATMARDEVRSAETSAAAQAATGAKKQRSAVRRGARRRELGHCESLLHVMDIELDALASCCLGAV